MDVKKIYNSLRYKNSRIVYNFINGVRYCVPRFLLKGAEERAYARFLALPQSERDYVSDRVNYYNKLDAPIAGSQTSQTSQTTGDWPQPPRLAQFGKTALRDFKLSGHSSPYFFDLYEYTRFFSGELEISYGFGDVMCLVSEPTIVKSRPVCENNANSVLMNLDKARHFVFVKDGNSFQDKKDMLMGRLGVGRKGYPRTNRIKFWETYFGHPRCDLGRSNRFAPGEPEERKSWTKPFLTIGEQLKFKFILCLEGNDVATNLKWVMSSNSLAVMPRPVYETWFMEGRLIPDHHYVEIKPDYSDLIERLDYYAGRPEESLRIIENAHRHVAQFHNQKREDLISMLVLRKYFNREP